jgi:hypothetical protein
MKKSRDLEKHIAVFGETGSGKTVLISSFYGAAQERLNIEKAGYNILAENPTQGTHLSQNYLGMKKSATLPAPNRFSSKQYSFLVKMKSSAQKKARASNRPSSLRLVWHDYPGEWFGNDVSGPEEADRRVETFRSLLQSDVAFLMVDGQRLLDNAGEEERYLKALFTNYCNSLLLLRDELLVDGMPLVVFPRIWILALSKSDVVPDFDVYQFRDLMLEKAGDELEKFRDVLGGLLDSSAALSFGSDFVLFSSAKFEAKKIELSIRVGLDLVLPLASVFAYDRHLRWVEAGFVSRKVAIELLKSAEFVGVAMGIVAGMAAKLVKSKSKAAGRIGALLAAVGPGLADAAKSLELKIAELDRKELAKRDDLMAVLAGFTADLERAEEGLTFLPSKL